MRFSSTSVRCLVAEILWQTRSPLDIMQKISEYLLKILKFAHLISINNFNVGCCLEYLQNLQLLFKKCEVITVFLCW